MHAMIKNAMLATTTICLALFSLGHAYKSGLEDGQCGLDAIVDSLNHELDAVKADSIKFERYMRIQHVMRIASLECEVERLKAGCE